MDNRVLFTLAGAGILIGVGSAAYYGIERAAQPPVFNPAPNPYRSGLYANGIVQSDQANGTDTALYPEVAGTVVRIAVTEGQSVKHGDILIILDDSVQRATAEQLGAQAQAAKSSLAALRAQPRPESLAVVSAQLEVAEATYKMNKDTFDKLANINRLNPELISREQLDTAANALRVAAANLGVAGKQYNLTKAGAWSYDIQAQAQQYSALEKAYASALALQQKYTLRAPVDGTILSIQTAVGSYVSAQGTYDTVSGGNVPLIIMGGGAGDQLTVRCYIDEILIHRLALNSNTPAQLFIRGTNTSIPLQFVRVQPYVSPKIQLSSARTERVDLRVLPVIFRLKKPHGVPLYPGQLVDVYIGAPASAADQH
ncbi:MAG: biotin/lipoyl-binding protein [Proteobacteria bacterium]|nr:biotin/lipoyl-binding protein [Pseudomonadota bacterium]